MNRGTFQQHLVALALLIAAALPLAIPLRAEDQQPPAAAAGVQQTVHRITGLFSPDREADLKEALKQIPGVELVSVDIDFSEATFSYDAAVAFPDTKPEQIVERLDQLLKQSSRHTFGAKPRCTVPREQLTRVEIAVIALDCKACALAAYETLAALDGVEQAAVDFKAGRATALIDPAKTARDKLEAALKERGVTVGQS